MKREDIIAFLGDHALLRGIPDPELRVAAASIEPVSFEDGRSLLVEGDAGTDCYFIKRGSVQVSSRNLVGKTLLLAELGPGALVGEIGLLRRERRTATVTAIGDVEALRLDRRSFELLAERSPLFHESLLLTVRIRLIHRLLRKASIWADIPDAELRGLAEITTVLRMKKGDVLVREGEAADRFFMIVGGSVEVRTAGRRKTQLRDGDFFGESGLLSGTPSDATATAAEDGELLVMGKNEFQYILDYYAPVRRQFMEMLRIRAPRLMPRAESAEAPDVVSGSALPKAKERWVDAAVARRRLRPADRACLDPAKRLAELRHADRRRLRRSRDVRRLYPGTPAAWVQLASSWLDLPVLRGRRRAAGVVSGACIAFWRRARRFLAVQGPVDGIRY